VDEWLKSVVC